MSGNPTLTEAGQKRADALPPEAEFADIIREAVSNHNDVDGVFWTGVAREVAQAVGDIALLFTAPEGWKLVPIKLPRHMKDAVARQVDDFSRDHARLFVADIWDTLLAEAPSCDGALAHSWVTAPEREGAGLREALKDALEEYDRNICPHEDTHRGGLIWTICDQCGCKWADDEGGFKPYVDPPKIAAARQIICDAPALASPQPAVEGPLMAHVVETALEKWWNDQGLERHNSKRAFRAGYVAAHSATLTPPADPKPTVPGNDAGMREAGPGTWINGPPPKPWCDEWFIAETIYGDRVVLRSLPEEFSYDFKTADETYIKSANIKRWMQFPDSDYVACVAALAQPAPVGEDETGVREALRYETDSEGAWVWLVWAISTAGAHLAAITQTEAKAGRYEASVARLYPGARVHIERAPVNHSFGASDLRSVAYRAAMKDARRQDLAPQPPKAETPASVGYDDPGHPGHFSDEPEAGGPPKAETPAGVGEDYRERLDGLRRAWGNHQAPCEPDHSWLLVLAARALSAAPAARPGDGVELTLTELHAANIARQAEWCPDQVPDLSFRGNELAGETGEACNVIKKLERERQGWRGPRATLNDLAEELADVVICADLCAVTAGIDLSAAVVAKFNATSDKVGISVRLAAAPAADGGRT